MKYYHEKNQNRIESIYFLAHEILAFLTENLFIDVAPLAYIYCSKPNQELQPIQVPAYIAKQIQ